VVALESTVAPPFAESLHNLNGSSVGKTANWSDVPLGQDSARRQRVLMFAYYFPPLGGGGVQRTLKHVKYLPAEGFDSIVVTGSRRGFFLRDPSLSHEVPAGTVLLRARALPLQQAQWTLDGLLRRARLPTRPASEALWPDGLVGWLPAAVWHGLRAVREHRPDVIYSTSSPTTAHLAALIVHRLTGLPWIADFRDGWTLHPVGIAAPSYYRSLERASAALERTIVAEASYATVADETVELLGLPAEDARHVIIRNGVDPDDLTPSAPATATPADTDRFRLTYVGSFYGNHDGAPVWSAVRELIRRGKLDVDRFELRIVGHASVERSKLDALPVTLTGYVDHQQALAEMANASALLFSLPPDNPGSSGKIYEYLTSGRPVLCVAGQDNRGYRLVQQLGAGLCAEPDDPTGIGEAIEHMVLDWQQGTLKVDPGVRDEALHRFSRRRLTGDLAAVLRAAIEEQVDNAAAAEPPTMSPV
jgi:glycosyltransferase involved in cell wall biosynthesis